MKTIIGSKDYQTIQDTINNKNLTLDDLFEFYSNREKYLDLEPLSQNWINRTETWLYEFKSITGIENINEIEPNTFQGYFSELNKVLEGDYFPSWLSQRVIKTIKDNSVTTHWVKARIDFIERLFKKALLIYPQNAHLSNAIAYLKKIKQ